MLSWWQFHEHDSGRIVGDSYTLRNKWYQFTNPRNYHEYNTAQNSAKHVTVKLLCQSSDPLKGPLMDKTGKQWHDGSILRKAAMVAISWIGELQKENPFDID